jgi:hypothetical protein
VANKRKAFVNFLFAHTDREKEKQNLEIHMRNRKPHKIFGSLFHEFYRVDKNQNPETNTRKNNKQKTKQENQSNFMRKSQRKINPF